jgi:hypothetical protein
MGEDDDESADAWALERVVSARPHESERAGASSRRVVSDEGAGGSRTDARADATSWALESRGKARALPWAPTKACAWAQTRARE